MISTLVSVSGCSSNTHPHHVSDPGVVKVNWASLSKPVQLVTYAVASMYRGEPSINTNHIQVNQTWTEADHKKMYLISFHGNFHIRGVSKSASALSFSLLDDLSKVWGLVATDDKGNVVWNNSDFDVIQENLRFEGKSKNWKGLYDLRGVQVWSKDSTQFGAWDEDQYFLSYIGTDPRTVHHFKYKLTTPVSAYSGDQDNVDLHRVFSVGGSGNGLIRIPQKSDTLHATVEWDGKTERFTLYCTTK
jgi:hypothetical protein